MTRHATHLLGTALAAALAAAAAADTYSGAGGTIADSPANGQVATTDFSIVVGDDVGIASLDSVVLSGLTHAWCGDISIELLHNGVGVTLVNRIGYTGTSAFGDSSNFDGVYEFTDSSNLSIWDAADFGGSSFIVPSASYFASGQDGVRIDIAGAFAGASAAGSWTLRVRDWAPTQVGSLGSWSVSITPVPAPGAAALACVAGGMGTLGRRRRRR